MATFRGVSISRSGGTVAYVPVTGASINPTRSLINEQSFGSAGEAKIYDGGVINTGSFDGALRNIDVVKYAITDVMDVMCGTLAALPYNTIVIGDDTNGLSFASTAINSFELSLTVKDYAKVKYNFVSCKVGTVAAITGVTSPTSYADPIPIASVSQISCPDAGIKFSAITINGQIPIDQDYYVIGTKQLYDILQSGNGSLSGTLTLASSEWLGLQKAAGDCGDIGTITLTLNTPGATCSDPAVLIATITITNVKIESGSASAQGRARFDKTINWRAEVNSTTNTTATMIVFA
jgi:hypothetical protein